MFQRVAFLLFIAFFSYHAFSGVPVAPSGPDSYYLGADVSGNSITPQDYSYGTSGGNVVSFDTNQTGIGFGLFGGYVLTDAGDSSFKNMRVEFGLSYTSTSTSESTLGSNVFIQPINGAFGSALSGIWNTSLALDTDTSNLELDFALKMDYPMGGSESFIFSPFVGFGIIKLKQEYTYSATDSGSTSNVTAMNITEELDSLYYGLKIGTAMTMQINESINLFATVGLGLMQASNDYTANQTYSGTVSSTSFNLVDNETEFSTAYEFGGGFSLKTMGAGTFIIEGKYKSLSVPYIVHPTGQLGTTSTRAYMDTEKLTNTLASLTWVIGF